MGCAESTQLLVLRNLYWVTLTRFVVQKVSQKKCDPRTPSLFLEWFDGTSTLPYRQLLPNTKPNRRRESALGTLIGRQVPFCSKKISFTCPSSRRLSLSWGTFLWNTNWVGWETATERGRFCSQYLRRVYSCWKRQLYHALSMTRDWQGVVPSCYLTFTFKYFW